MRENEPYDQYAQECRKLAATMKDPAHKKQLEEMAEAWMSVANERKKMQRKGQAETPQSTRVQSREASRKE